MVQLRNFINQIHLWGEKKIWSTSFDYFIHVCTVIGAIRFRVIQTNEETKKQIYHLHEKGENRIKKKNEKSMNLEAVTTTGGWAGCDFP